MKNLRDITKRPGRIQMVRLAEDYDGIGQYVLVSMSQSSVSAAYKARVAAGDFGGGRHIPAGTRVPVISVHGQLEVLLGNHPRELLCQDIFNRAVIGGWGNPSDFPSLNGWTDANGVSGDDWYTEYDPEYYSVVDGIGIVDTDAVPAGDPWIWFFPKGDPTTWSHNFEYELRLKLEVPDLGTFPNTFAQFDFYLGDSEKVGTIGSTGDTMFLTLECGNGETTVRVGSFGGWDNSNYFEHVEAGHRLINVWVKAKFRMQNYQLRTKIWPENETEPDWMAGLDFPSGILPDWGGLKIVIVGPYKAVTLSPFTIQPCTLYLDYLKDVHRNICQMSGNDFVPNFNGPVT